MDTSVTDRNSMELSMIDIKQAQIKINYGVYEMAYL